MRGHIVGQIGKITLLRVTGQVRPHCEISRILNNTQHQLHTWFVSHNVMRNKNPAIIVPFTHVNLSPPTT